MRNTNHCMAYRIAAATRAWLSKRGNTACVRVEKRKEGCGYFQFLCKRTSHYWPTARELCLPARVRAGCCRVTFERGSLAEILNLACQRSNSIAMLEADRVVAIPRIHVIRIPSRNDKPLLCIYIGRALGMSFYRFAER